LTIIGSEILSPAQTGKEDFELQLQLVIFARQVDPGPNGGQLNLAWRASIAYVNWPPNTFEAFKAAAKSRAEQFWSNKFRISPPSNYSFFNWPAGAGGRPRSVICTLSITYVNSPNHASRIINCYRRASGETTAALDSGSWTDAILTDQPHNLTDNQNKVVPTKLITVAHEVGHLIGLDHPAGSAAGCTGHELVCYGLGGDAWQIRNIMGAGDQVDQSNAKPWLERMVQHTGVPKDQWTVHVPGASGQSNTASTRSGS
jgi:hypothetical protein